MPHTHPQEYRPSDNAVAWLKQLKEMCTRESDDALQLGAVQMATNWHKLAVEVAHMMFACRVAQKAPKIAP